MNGFAFGPSCGLSEYTPTALPAHTRHVRQHMVISIHGAWLATAAHERLGSRMQADAVETRWPSGQIDRMTNVKAGGVVTVTER